MVAFQNHFNSFEIDVRISVWFNVGFVVFDNQGVLGMANQYKESTSNMCWMTARLVEPTH